MGYATIYQGPTPPGNPTIDSLWLSTSMADVRVSADLRDAGPIISPSVAAAAGVVFGGTDTNYQEPNAYFDAVSGNYVVIFTGSSAGVPALFWAYAPNPLGVWTPGGAIGGGTLGEHSGVYIENGVGYLTYCDNSGATLWLKTFSIGANGGPANVSAATSILTLAGNLAGIGGPFGNVQIFKRAPGDYVLNFEAAWNSTKFQMGTAVATAPGGPYVVQTMPIMSSPVPAGGGYPTPTASGSAYPLMQAYPAGEGGNIFVVQEGSKYIGFSHWAYQTDQYTSEIWRAVTTDYSLANWTWDPVPFIRRGRTGYGVDQVADPSVCFGPSGAAFLFWDGVNNFTGATPSAPGVLFCAALQPVLKQWDGTGWQVISGAQDFPVPEFFNYQGVVAAAQPLNNLDDRPGNSTGGAFTMTLPRAVVGNRVRVSNVGSANNITIAVNGTGTDTIPLAAGTTLAPGAVRTFRCYTFGVWVWS